MVGGVKSHLESNPKPTRVAWRAQTKPCVHQEDATESEPDLFECLSVSCGGTGQQWPAVGTGALGAGDLGMAVALLEAVAIYPTIEPPELTQDWGNRLLEGTNKTFCTPGPRDPTETVPELCLSVSCGGMGQQWPASGAGALGAADLCMT